MIAGEGVVDGVAYRFELVSDRRFKLTASRGDVTRSADYESMYPTLWGTDVEDTRCMDAIMDRLIGECREP